MFHLCVCVYPSYAYLYCHATVPQFHGKGGCRGGTPFLRVGGGGSLGPDKRSGKASSGQTGLWIPPIAASFTVEEAAVVWPWLVCRRRLPCAVGLGGDPSISMVDWHATHSWLVWFSLFLLLLCQSKYCLASLCSVRARKLHLQFERGQEIFSVFCAFVCGIGVVQQIRLVSWINTLYSMFS